MKFDINSIDIVGFEDKMHKNVGKMRNEELGMRNEELAKLNRVVLKYEVKDSIERSDFAVAGSCPNKL